MVPRHHSKGSLCARASCPVASLVRAACPHPPARRFVSASAAVVPAISLYPAAPDLGVPISPDRLPLIPTGATPLSSSACNDKGSGDDRQSLISATSHAWVALLLSRHHRVAPTFLPSRSLLHNGWPFILISPPAHSIHLDLSNPGRAGSSAGHTQMRRQRLALHYSGRCNQDLVSQVQRYVLHQSLEEPP